MNITDVGHLTSDQDEGEDKLEKGAIREQKSIQEIIKFYTSAFLNDLKKLNIKKADKIPYASKHTKEIITMIKILEAKGFTYDTPEAIYFDVSKFPNYYKLSGQKLEEKMTGARTGVVKDSYKKHPADFALWFKIVGKFKNHILHWPSRWGEGFPGWHIECSAMSRKYLGQPFDIHVGGIDHLPVHHTNEIAQSEAAFGVPLANYWMHGEFLLLNDSKMAKSEGGFLTLAEIIKNKFNSLALRYLTLTSHYRSKLNFTFESLHSAQNALNNLYTEISGLKLTKTPDRQFLDKFLNSLNNDLNTPQAVALIWDLIRSKNLNTLATLFRFDEVLGLDLKNIWTKSQKEIKKIKLLIAKYSKARKNKDYKTSDALRKNISNKGFIIEDSVTGTIIKKKF
jgi:cysteinyl-tRNA synthetase